MPHPVKCRYLGNGNHPSHLWFLLKHAFFLILLHRLSNIIYFTCSSFSCSAIWVTLFSSVFFSLNSLPSCPLPIRQSIVCKKRLPLKPWSLYGTLCGSLNTIELKLVSHFSIISQMYFCSFKFCAHMCDTVEF